MLRFIKRLVKQKAFPLLIILIVMMIFTMVYSSGVLKGAPISDMFSKGFMSRTNWVTNFYNLVIQIMMMTGLSCILISGNFDMSISSQATLGSLIFAIVLKQAWSSWWSTILITIGVALVFGLINTFLVNEVKLPAFIATIGISSVYTGLCNVVSGGDNVQVSDPAMVAFGSKTFGPVPLMFIIAIVILIIVEYILFKTKFGRSLYMSGSNPAAARLCGLNPMRMRTILFCVNSTLAVFGGVFWTCQTKMASPTSIISSAPNMTATSAAVLGGVSFFGGTGELVGPLIAVFLVNIFENMLNILHVSEYYVIILQGVLLVVSLIIDYFGVKKREAANIAAAMAK